MARLSWQRTICLLLPATVLLLFVACASPQKRVAKRTDELAQEWQTNLAYQAALPERTLDWPAALAQLRAGNLKLRQSGTDLTNAQEAVRQVYRDLVPMLDLHAGITKRIVDIPSISAKDITFSADSFFNIPGLASFGARLFITRLGYLRAQAAYLLTEREQIIELYKLFWASQDVVEEARHLQNEIRTAHAFESVDPFTAQMMLTQTELRDLSRHREEDSFQQRASELLGSHAFHWSFSTKGVPELPYDVSPLPLADTNRVARLQLRLAALELEAARAEREGIKLRYWPELSIFVTGPPLYQHSFGQEQFWRASDLQASADAFWTLDTRGYISRQLRMTKRQQALQEERLRQDALSLMQKLLLTQNLLTAAQEKQRDLEQQLQVLEAVPPAQNFNSLQKYATEYQTTADQLRQVRREAAELKSLFWFVDENAWQGIAPLNPLVVSVTKPPLP